MIIIKQYRKSSNMRQINKLMNYGTKSLQISKLWAKKEKKRNLNWQEKGQRQQPFGFRVLRACGLSS